MLEIQIFVQLLSVQGRDGELGTRNLKLQVDCKSFKNQFFVNNQENNFKNFQEPAATKLTITKLLQNTNRSFALAVVKKKKRMHIHYKTKIKQLQFPTHRAERLFLAKVHLAPSHQKLNMFQIFTYLIFVCNGFLPMYDMHFTLGQGASS